MNFDFRVAPRGTIVLGTNLARLELAQLVRTDAERGEFIFKHALVQDSAYASLTRAERKRLHRHVANAYETIYADRGADEYAALLAQHYGAAGDDANTLLYATRAGDHAANVYANTEAIAFYTQALDAAKRSHATTAELIHLYTKRGRIFEVTGNDVDALATYTEMSEFARLEDDSALRLQSLLLCGKLYAAPSPMHDRTRALALAQEANQLALELGNREAQAYGLWNQQLLYIYNNEIPDAVRVGEQALVLARELDMQELLGYILGDLTRAYLQSGQMHKIPPIQAEAIAIWRALDNKPMLADNLMQVATYALLRGDYDKTIALTNEGIEISQAIGSILSLMSNQGTQLYPHFDRGDIASTLQLAESILREASGMSGGFNVPMQSTYAAWVYATIGAFDRAAGLAQQAIRRLEQPIPEFFRAWAWALLTRYYVAIGDMPNAFAALATSGLETHIGQIDPTGIMGVSVLGECLIVQGEYTRVARIMAERVILLRQMGFHQSLPDILWVQAQAVGALGDTAQAYDLLQQARVEAERVQGRRLLWQIYTELSEMERARGNADAADSYRSQARTALEFIAAHTPKEHRESFLNLPHVRALL